MNRKPIAVSPVTYWLVRYWPDLLVGLLGAFTLLSALVIL